MNLFVLLQIIALDGSTWHGTQQRDHMVALHSRRRYSLSVKCWVHRRRLLPLFLVCIWITTWAFAEHASAQFPLCQPENLPCCPSSTNTTNVSCPACRLSVPVAAKDKSEQERSQSVLQAKITRTHRLGGPVASTRELTSGFRYRRVVFSLKDDLRI
jgi:hypothetical protein